VQCINGQPVHNNNSKPLIFVSPGRFSGVISLALFNDNYFILKIRFYNGAEDSIDGQWSRKNNSLELKALNNKVLYTAEIITGTNRVTLEYNCTIFHFKSNSQCFFASDCDLIEMSLSEEISSR